MRERLRDRHAGEVVVRYVIQLEDRTRHDTRERVDRAKDRGVAKKLTARLDWRELLRQRGLVRAAG